MKILVNKLIVAFSKILLPIHKVGSYDSSFTSLNYCVIKMFIRRLYALSFRYHWTTTLHWNLFPMMGPHYSSVDSNFVVPSSQCSFPLRCLSLSHSLSMHIYNITIWHVVTFYILLYILSVLGFHPQVLNWYSICFLFLLLCKSDKNPL